MGKRPLLAVAAGLTLLCSTFLPTTPVHARQRPLKRHSEDKSVFLKQTLGELAGEIESVHRPENRLLLYRLSVRAAFRVDRERGIDMARNAINLAATLVGQNLERLRDPTLNNEQVSEARKKESGQFAIYRELLLQLADVEPEDAKKLLFETRAKVDDPEEEPHRRDLAVLDYEIETRVLMGREDNPDTMAEALRRTFEAADENNFRSILRRFARKFPDAASREIDELLRRIVTPGDGFTWHNTRYHQVKVFLDIISDQFPSGLRARSYRQYDPGTLTERSRAAFFVAMGDVSMAIITDAQRQALHSRAARNAAERAFSPFREYAEGIALYARDRSRDIARVMAEKPNEEAEEEPPPRFEPRPAKQATGGLSVGEVLAAAANATSTGEFNALIEKAAFMIGSGGDIDGGAEVLDRIENRFLRQTVKQVYVRTFPKSRGTPRPERPQRIRTPGESKQARFSRQVGEANRFLGESNTGAAAGALNEAIQTAGGEIPKDLEHFLNLLKVAEVFATFDPLAAENILSNVMYKLNSLLEASVTLDGFLTENKSARIEEQEFQLENLPPLIQNLLGVRTGIIAVGHAQPASVGALLSRINRVEIRARLRAEVVSELVLTGDR